MFHFWNDQFLLAILLISENSPSSLIGFFVEVPVQYISLDPANHSNALLLLIILGEFRWINNPQKRSTNKIRRAWKYKLRLETDTNTPPGNRSRHSRFSLLPTIPQKLRMDFLLRPLISPPSPGELWLQTGYRFFFLRYWYSYLLIGNRCYYLWSRNE